MADYINREGLINNRPEGRNPKQISKEEYNKGWNDCRSAFYTLIKDMPAADVAPVRHGKWLEWFPGDCTLIMTGEEMLYRCSSCNAKYPDVEGYKHCPNCGAKMDYSSNRRMDDDG